jgi:hypothetical protein
MIDARIDGDSLEVQIAGRDFWLHLLRSNRPWAGTIIVRLPLDQITAARVEPPKKGIKVMNAPTRNAYGTGVFDWCRRGAPVLSLQMNGQLYEFVNLSVPDPERLAQEIRMATGVPELATPLPRPSLRHRHPPR